MVYTTVPVKSSTRSLSRWHIYPVRSIDIPNFWRPLHSSIVLKFHFYQRRLLDGSVPISGPLTILKNIPSPKCPSQNFPIKFRQSYKRNFIPTQFFESTFVDGERESENSPGRRAMMKNGRSKVELRSTLMKLKSIGRGKESGKRETDPVEDSRTSQIPDIGINSTIKHSSRPCLQSDCDCASGITTRRFMNRACLERKSNPLGTCTTENRLHICCPRRRASPCIRTYRVSGANKLFVRIHWKRSGWPMESVERETERRAHTMGGKINLLDRSALCTLVSKKPPLRLPVGDVTKCVPQCGHRRRFRTRNRLPDYCAEKRVPRRARISDMAGDK